MTTLVKINVPAEQFALADTFREVPSVTFDAVRLVSHDPGQVVPLLWATSADPSNVYEALQADGTTTAVELVSQRDRDSLFRVRWTARARFVTSALVDEGGGIVSAHGRNEEWAFWILFPDRNAVSATYDVCEMYDVRIEQIRSLDDTLQFDTLHLTETQLETINRAVDSGYYSIPRDATTEELAAELDVSHQALSERLRRGHRALIETVIRP